MRVSARIRIAILALMLVVSHVALISHVTGHFEPALEQCELCVSQAQTLTAIPSAAHGVLLDSSFAISSFETSHTAVPARYGFAFRQRAPPLLSA